MGSGNDPGIARVGRRGQDLAAARELSRQGFVHGHDVVLVSLEHRLALARDETGLDDVSLKPELELANLAKLHHDQRAQAREADSQDREGDLHFEQRVAAPAVPPCERSGTVGEWFCSFSLESRLQGNTLA